MTGKPTKEVREIMEQRGMKESDLPPLVYLAEEGSEDYSDDLKKGTALDNSKSLKEYMMDNFSAEERANMTTPKYFYEVTFDKPGGLVMPLIVEYKYSDGSTEKITYPPQVWRKNDEEVGKVIASDKEITAITVDPDQETADVDTSNNSWPKRKKLSKFNKFKNNKN